MIKYMTQKYDYSELVIKVQCQEHKTTLIAL